MATVFDTETIRLVTLFENVTGADVKDCLQDNSMNVVYYVIEEGMAGIAIGKNGTSVRQVENLIKKNIKVFEFSKDLETFIKKLIPQTIDVKIKNENEKITVEIKVEKSSKALIIGRDGKNLKLYKELVQRNHNVDDLIVR